MIQDNPDGININQAVSSSLLRKRLQKIPSSVSVFSENASLLSQVKVAKGYLYLSNFSQFFILCSKSEILMHICPYIQNCWPIICTLCFDEILGFHGAY